MRAYLCVSAHALNFGRAHITQLLKATRHMHTTGEPAYTVNTHATHCLGLTSAQTLRLLTFHPTDGLGHHAIQNFGESISGGIGRIRHLVPNC